MDAAASDPAKIDGELTALEFDRCAYAMAASLPRK
jgi:hypothetical protein